MISRPEVNNPKSMSSRFRKKRFGHIETLIRDVLKYKDEARILDIGGRRDYWQMLAPDLTGRVILTISNLAVEIDIGKQENDPIDVRYVVADACHMPEFPDGSFDLAHSNSVIEHVGSLHNMVRFSDEVRRVGNGYYVQTPNLWFPIEPHFGVPFLHWLPAPTRARLVSRYRIGFGARVSDYREALDKVDHIQIINEFAVRNLFPDAEIRRERFALLVKSVTAIRPFLPSRSAS
jgi:Methyltransferase domain